MKSYTCTVLIDNGSFHRSFNGVVAATNWHTAAKKAIPLAIGELRKHLRCIGIRKRLRIDRVSVGLRLLSLDATGIDRIALSHTREHKDKTS